MKGKFEPKMDGYDDIWMEVGGILLCDDCYWILTVFSAPIVNTLSSHVYFTTYLETIRSLKIAPLCFIAIGMQLNEANS